MRKVEITDWCDACWQADQTETRSTQAWSVSVKAGEGVPAAIKTVLVCDGHAQPLVALEVLYRGAPDQQPVASAASALEDERFERACPVCGKVMPRKSLATHIWSHRRDSRPPAPRICPVCHQEFENGNGCSVHRALVHGYSATVAALEGVPGWDLSRAQLWAKGHPGAGGRAK